MQKPIILVIGATGGQGGSVARALLQGGKFNVRMLTRRPDSPQALALREAGAEVAVGDLDDMDSLKRAMQGCYGVFGVTNFWEHYEHEYQQGKNLIDAVKASDIQHFVFSSLANLYKLSGNTLPVPHFDLKAQLEDYARSLQLRATFVQLPFYYENFLGFFPIQPDEDGGLWFGSPQGDTPLAMVSVEDLGGVVATIFDHPVEYIGRVVGVVGDHAPCSEYAAAMTRVFGRKVTYKYIPHAVYAGLGFPGAEELANMFEAQRLYVLDRQLHLIESYGLNPNMQRFEKWLIRNRDKFNELLEAKNAPAEVG